MSAKQTPEIAARQIGEHAPDCRSIVAFKERRWNTVWGPLDRERPTVFATRSLKIPEKRGTRGAHVYCLVFLCNSTNCHAKLIVRADSIFHALRRRGVTETR